jgi:hypothetical protein
LGEERGSPVRPPLPGAFFLVKPRVKPLPILGGVGELGRDPADHSRRTPSSVQAPSGATGPRRCCSCRRSTGAAFWGGTGEGARQPTPAWSPSPPSWTGDQESEPKCIRNRAPCVQGRRPGDQESERFGRGRQFASRASIRVAHCTHDELNSLESALVTKDRPAMGFRAPAS